MFLHDLSNKQFGNFFVVKFAYTKNHKSFWLCKCLSCGKNIALRSDVITSCRRKNCGCSNDLSHRIFGDLEVKKRVIKTIPTKHTYALWLCHCKCGNDVIVDSKSLLSGNTVSCGCHRKLLSQQRLNDFHASDKVFNTSIYAITNKTPYKNNKSGHKGVFFRKDINKWRAYICFMKKMYNLGSFDNYDDALATRIIAENTIFSGFLEWYKEYIKHSIR